MAGKQIILIMSRFFTTGVILEKGDCLYALIVLLRLIVYFSNLSNNSFKVKVVITGLPFKAKFGIWQANS